MAFFEAEVVMPFRGPKLCKKQESETFDRNIPSIKSMFTPMFADGSR